MLEMTYQSLATLWHMSQGILPFSWASVSNGPSLLDLGRMGLARGVLEDSTLEIGSQKCWVILEFRIRSTVSDKKLEWLKPNSWRGGIIHYPSGARKGTTGPQWCQVVKGESSRRVWAAPN